jgi:hypothetical protein
LDAQRCDAWALAQTVDPGRDMTKAWVHLDAQAGKDQYARHEGDIGQSVEIAQHSHTIDDDHVRVRRLRGAEPRAPELSGVAPALDRIEMRWRRFVRRDDQACRRMLLAQKVYAEGSLALVLYCGRLLDERVTATDDDQVRDLDLLLELLTPVAKSWPSQWCVTANDLAIPSSSARLRCPGQ